MCNRYKESASLDMLWDPNDWRSVRISSNITKQFVSQLVCNQIEFVTVLLLGNRRLRRVLTLKTIIIITEHLAVCLPYW